MPPVVGYVNTTSVNPAAAGRCWTPAALRLKKRQPTKAAPKSLAGDYVTFVRSGTAAGFTDTNPLTTGINGNGF
jgi:hypothetical protein